MELYTKQHQYWYGIDPHTQKTVRVRTKRLGPPREVRVPDVHCTESILRLHWLPFRVIMFS